MKKLILLLSLSLLLANSGFSQALTKSEKAKLKQELRTYMKNLEGYKTKMEDIEMTLDSNDAQIKRLKDELAYTDMNQTEMVNKVNAYKREVEKLQGENETLKNWNDSTFVASGKIDEKHETSGTVYKVQLGLYKSFNINKYFDTPRYIGYELVNGMNRYIISYFDNEKVATDFVKDIRKLGIKDAFVAKYVDGKRKYDWSESTVKTSDELKSKLGEGN